MYKIGITGSIGTGKTTIASMFAKFHISIFNADNEIKKILTRKEIKQKLKDAWPSVLKTNTIDKHKLRTIIFSSKREKKKLERISDDIKEMLNQSAFNTGEILNSAQLKQTSSFRVNLQEKLEISSNRELHLEKEMNDYLGEISKIKKQREKIDKKIKKN